MSPIETRPLHLYDDYGHTPGSTLWIWHDRHLQEVPAGLNVFHYKVWGMLMAQTLYRGRNDALQHITSIFPPEEKIGTHSEVPSPLQDELHHRFPESQLLVFDL